MLYLIERAVLFLRIILGSALVLGLAAIYTIRLGGLILPLAATVAALYS